MKSSRGARVLVFTFTAALGAYGATLGACTNPTNEEPAADGAAPSAEGSPSPGFDGALPGTDSSADVPVVDGSQPDTSPPADATVTDSSTVDANVADTTTADTNTADTNVPDTNVADTNVADTNVADTNVADTNVADTNTADTNAPDANDAAAGDAAEQDSGADADDGSPFTTIASVGGFDLAIDSTSVYWTTGRYGGGPVYKAPITGLPPGDNPTVIANIPSSTGIAVNNGVVYVAHVTALSAIYDYPSEVVSFPASGVPDGGAPTSIGKMSNVWEMATDGVSVFFDTFDGNGATVARFPIGAGPDAGYTTISSSERAPAGLVTQSGLLYWASTNSYGDTILSAPTSAAEPDSGIVPLASTNFPLGGGIAIDQNFIYYNDGSYRIMRAPLSGTADGGAAEGTVVAAGGLGGNCIYVDSSYVYWISNNGIYEVLRVPVTGGDGGAPEVLALASTSGVHCLTGDASYIYWVSGSAVMRMRKN